MVERRFPMRKLLVAGVAALALVATMIVSAGPATAYPPTEYYPGSDPRASVGGSFKGEISVDYCFDVGFVAIGRGLDDGIWASVYNDTTLTWSNWKSLGGKTSATPALFRTDRPAPAYCVMYVRGLDDRLYFADVKPGLPAATWTSNPTYGFLGSAPTIGQLNDTQTMAVRGTDGVVYTGQLTINGVASWTSQGGQTNYAPSLRAVRDTNSNYVGWCLSAIGLDGAWWEKCSYGPQANQWRSLGGYFTGAPGSYNYGPYGYSVRGARGGDGGLWLRSDNTEWFSLGGQMTAERPGFGYSSANPWVGVLAGDGRTWQRTSFNLYSLDSWNTWQRLGG